MVVCGVHGDETHAIKLCWNFYKAMKVDNRFQKDNFIFIFNANESALKHKQREFKPFKYEDIKDLNRAFHTEDSFKEMVEQILDIMEQTNPDTLLDVHNSVTCNETVLIDYQAGGGPLLEEALSAHLNPMLRPTQNFGTIKAYAMRKRIPAFTVEFSPMTGEIGNNDCQGIDYLVRCVSALRMASEQFEKFPENWDYIPKQKYISNKVYSPVNAIVNWSNPDPYSYYNKNAVVCRLVDMETENITLIRAPQDMVIQDICCPDLAFVGDPLFEYTPRFCDEEDLI